MLIRHLLSIALMPPARRSTPSSRIGAWLLLFVAINHTYFLLLEEPGLVARFGEEYERYRAAVPRWLPRRVGWP